MAEDLKKIKIKDLPNIETINDSDLFPNTDSLETHNVTADVIAEYVSQNKHVTDTYINKNQIGVANGIAPLNTSKKINGTYITYGTTTNTAYSGLAGKTLETNLDNHLLDENAHGLGNVDNTSDMDKPVSTAQQKALDKKIDKTTVASSSTLGLIKSGTDITVDSNGNVSVNDDSHNHIIENIDGLQSSLNEKVPTTRSINGKALSANITLSASDVGADASGTANTVVSNHNTSTSAHNDIRSLITGLTNRLNALADSDDTTLDQMSEIVAYIKANKTIIDSITTSKINVSDIVNNLTTNVTNKPLSAAQGVTIKALIDALQTEVDTKVDKINGKGLSTNDYTTTEKNKLSGIATGAEVNQNAFSNVKVGSTTVTADDKTDTLELVAGTNVVITPDATNDKITISATDTKYTHPSYTSKSSGLYKITVDATGHISSATAVTKSDITALGIPASDTNTHYSSKNVVAGSSTATSNTTSALSNGSVYLISVENGAVTSSHKITGSGATTVTTDEGGNIVISSTDTNVNTNTTYTLTKSGSTITLTGSDGSTTSVTDSDNNTTYSKATTSTNGLMSSTDKTKLNNTNIAYGTCSTEAATVAKVITISGNTNWALTAGSRITVKFSYTNTASNPTFNVNSTGAKSVWYNTALITTSNLGYAGTANRPMDFVYDGTQYIFVGWSIDSNTTYSQASLGQGYGTCSTAASTVAKVVTLSNYALVTNGIVAVKFTNAVPASATMNINSKGAKAIYYRGVAITASVINAGDIATFIYNGSQYHLLTVDRQNDGGNNEIISDTEPTGQSVGDYWLLEY